MLVPDEEYREQAIVLLEEASTRYGGIGKQLVAQRLQDSLGIEEKLTQAINKE